MGGTRRVAEPPSRSERTTIEVSRETSDLLGSLVGRCGRTKGDVARAGAEALVAKLTPLPIEVVP
jgi:hypothetical protein